MKKVLVFDNYDSFTFNLVHILRDLGADVTVFRNDEITVESASAFSKILISPGPGIPDEAGILKPLIRELAPTHRLLVNAGGKRMHILSGCGFYQHEGQLVARENSSCFDFSCWLGGVIGWGCSEFKRV